MAITLDKFNYICNIYYTNKLKEHPMDKISSAEHEIMKILWREQRPLKVAEISAELEQKKAWNKSTTGTLVTRLRDKGIIEPAERYGVARYIPLVTEDEYILAQEQSLLSKFGSAKKLAIAMVRNGHLSDADIDDLRNYFNAGMGGDNRDNE